MARLNKRRLFSRLRRAHPRYPVEEGANGDGIGRVVGPLIDAFERIVRTDEARRQLNATGAPSVGNGHLPGPKGHLVTGNSHGLQNSPTNHALGLLVEVGEVVVLVANPVFSDPLHVHASSACAAGTDPSWAACFAKYSARSFRTS